MTLLSAIARWTHGRLRGSDAEVTGAVAIDTRQLKRGELFAAFKGERVDGHHYLDQAMRCGAAGALVERPVDSPLPQIQVADMTTALMDWAGAVRLQHPAQVIGITGSNGKTTVKTLLASILGLHGRTHASAGNFNNEIGLPLSLLSMPPDTRYAILEMGAGKPDDIAALATIARPNIGVITCIASAHLERMGTLETVAQTKGALYQALPVDGVAIINADDAFADFFTALVEARQVLRFGLAHKAGVSAKHIELQVDHSHWLLRTPVGEAEVTLALPGRHHVLNALAATAAALALAVPLPTIVAGLIRVKPMAGRGYRMTMPAGWTLIDDSYNANPDSLAAAIELLYLADGERWLVLGDMAELGHQARALHESVGTKARQCGIEHLFATGPLSAVAVAAFGTGGVHFADHIALLAFLQARLHAGVTCLVKGSRSSGMEQLVTLLRQPGTGEESIHVA